MCCTRVTLPHLDSTRERVEPGNISPPHHTSYHTSPHFITPHHTSSYRSPHHTTPHTSTSSHHTHTCHCHASCHTHTHTYMSSSFPQGEGRAASASRLMPSCGRIYNIWGNTRFGAIMNVYTLSDAFHLVATLRMY